MKLKSIFNKRNYKYFYYSIKKYPKHVKNIKTDNSDFVNFDKLVKYFELNNFKNFAVVASGPSSKEIIFQKDVLYFCTNDSIELVKDFNYVYIVQDLFYLTKYLKTHKGEHGWRGSIFFLENIMLNRKSHIISKTYLENKSREKKEFLISNFINNNNSSRLFNEFLDKLKDVGVNFKSINSGFTCVQMCFLFSIITDKKMTIYGLDMGFGGEEYFNKKQKLGKSIKSNNNREKVREVLKSIYNSDVKVCNMSNFMKNEI